MTVLTMPSSEKKSDNVPLVTNIEIDPCVQGKDLEAGKIDSNEAVKSRYLVLRVMNHSVYSIWTLIYIMLMALFIAFMVIYGKHVYKLIGITINDETDMFYNTGAMPLNDNLDNSADLDNNMESLSYMESKSLENFARNMDKMRNPMDSSLIPSDPISEMKEEFSIDLKDESYEKVLPILSLANTARFIFDFSKNVTGIVDMDKKKCFILPFRPNAVTPPKSFFDLLFKMSSGYYTIDVNEVMHNMRIVKPEIKDLTEYGIYISKDCAGYSTYKLEKIVSGVV